MSELSAEKLAELREIAGKATPGPWSAMGYDDYPGDEGVCILGAANTATGSHMIGYSLPNGRSRDQVESDGAHFAAFDPPTVIQLLDRIADLEAWRAKIWGEAYRQGVDDERHHRVDYRKAGQMSERITDERLAELVDIRAALHKDYATPCLGEISDMAAELAEFREREAASTVEWATDQVEPGRPVYPAVRHRRSQYAAEMAVSNPESEARRVLKRVAIHGPWEEVTDDD